MDENEQGVVDWVNTFELSKPCTELAELSDGNIISEILYQICPSYFEQDTLNKDAAGNWALAAGNIRKLLRSLDGYFTTVLHKRIDTSHVDVNSIAKNNDHDQILHLLELVVGAAVMCEDKATFISKIFELNEVSQAVLKGLVEQAMGRAEDLEGEGEGEEGGHSGAEKEGPVDVDVGVGGGLEDLRLPSSMSNEEQVRVREMVQHLQAERARLLGEVGALEQANEGLKSQLARTKERAHQQEQEREAVEGSDRSRVQALEALTQKLSAELEEAKREGDLRLVEAEGLRHDLRALQQRLEASREIQARLEMENHQQADELDIAKDKVAKLARAEQAVEKYQKRLEEMVELKRQNKELCDRMDEYLDQIHALESANKGLATLQKMVETYKNKAVDLETEKFEAQSSVEMRDQQLAQLRADLDKAKEGRRQALDEAAALRVQLEQHLEAAAVAAEEAGTSPRKGGGGLDDAYHTETLPELREKVRRLERELRLAQAGAGSEDGSATGPDGAVVPGASAVAQEVAIVQAELDDTRQQKKRLEESLLATKKQLAEAQYELTKAQEAAAESERSADSSTQLRETAQRLAESANTVRLLQEKLKEKETTINKVEQEKSKLENYTKKSLATFKDKYMAVLQTLRDEKEEMQQKMRAQLEKSERNQDTWHREERLISSAMFELGVRIMDQKIQSQMMQQPSLGATPGGDASQYLLSAVNSPFFSAGAGAGAGGGTFLSGQREALARSAADAAVRGTPGPAAAGLAPGAGGGVGTPLASQPEGRRLF